SDDAGATWYECYPYLSREDLLAGITIEIATGLTVDFFRIGFFTFTFRAGESDPDAPDAGC
ncbi:hypothetical protein U2075_14655, partial [Listeria monocytogenes]|uniref:hypothetical protein n=1 Tax=Listeria monocytogenes TaxID=1639 RepID=UPI002FDC3CC9